MVIVRSSEDALEEVTHEAAKGTQIQWMLGPKQGTPTFTLRRFVVEPGGHTPRHRHDWEHVAYILSGAATIYAGGEDYRVEAGTAVFIFSLGQT